MIKKYKHLGLLLCVLVIGLSLRLFKLDQVPYGALIDEAHFGYIAYSLIQTGADEHGQFWPLVFRGFGDYKLPLYAYTLVPVVGLFDLSVFSIRLPSALAGTLSVLLFYYLVLGILAKKHHLALLGALVMAVSPWPFILSRFGFESNLALMVWLLALNGLVRWQRSWRWGLLATLSMAVTWYGYIAYRPVTGLFILTILIYLWWRKISSRRWLVMFLALFVILIVPLFIFGQKSNTARLQQIGIFADQGIVMTIDENRAFCAQRFPQVYCYSVYNKATSYAQTLTHRFLASFSPDFLFLQGEKSDKYLTLDGFGQLSWVLLGFYVLGFYVLVFNQLVKINRWPRIIIMTGLLLSPLPNILATDPQKVRLSPLLPFIVLLIVLGAVGFWQLLAQLLNKQSRYRKKIWSGLVILVFGGVWLWQMVWFFTSFYGVNLYKNDHLYFSYVRDLNYFLADQYHQGAKIYWRPIYSDPLMYFAFYAKVNPANYQKTARLGPLETSGFQHTVGLTDDLTMTEKDLLTVACEAVVADRPVLMVTNSRVDPPAISLYQAKSANGVSDWAYVYDAVKYGGKYIDLCQQHPSQVKDAIRLQYQQQVRIDPGYAI